MVCTEKNRIHSRHKHLIMVVNLLLFSELLSNFIGANMMDNLYHIFSDEEDSAHNYREEFFLNI